MKAIELKSRKLLRNIFNCFSITAVAFIFQACYGMPHDDFYDIKITGTVTSKTTNLPVQGIKVAVDKGVNHGFTDKNGKFDFYASVPDWDYSTNSKIDEVNIHFLDIDGVENGSFADTTIIIKPAYKDEVRINVALREKQ